MDENSATARSAAEAQLNTTPPARNGSIFARAFMRASRGLRQHGRVKTCY
jgi:hypothetical protein